MKTDVDGTSIVPGKKGHLYEYSSDECAVMLMLTSKRAFTLARQRLLAAGCTSRQRGDMEGSASFSPENSQAVTQAIREARIACIPRRTAAQLATLRDKGSRFRFQSKPAQPEPSGEPKLATQLDKTESRLAQPQYSFK